MSTILVIDDELSMLEVLSEMLSREGYTVVTTPRTEEAVGLHDERQGVLWEGGSVLKEVPI